MNRHRLTAVPGPVLLLVLLAGLVALRVHLVDRNLGTYLACPGCFDSMVLAADAAMFAAVAGLLLLAGLLRPAALGRVVHLTAGIVLLVYAADLVVFRLFNSRLFLSDASLYFAEPAALWNQLSSGLGGAPSAVALLAGGMLMLLWLALAPPARQPPQRLLLVAVLALSLGAAAVTRGAVYVNDWAVDNVFAANLATSEHTLYGREVAAAALATLQPARSVAGPAPGEGLNVILVLLESWSAWHSAAWGGYEDWTPRLDAAAARGTSFSNFHSIGFSTDKGLVGILAGQQIWAPFLHLFETPPFHSMWGVERTLPRAFSPHGYHTAFLTSGPLTLYRKGEWMRDLGFAEVEGNEHAFYAGETRYAFDAASDRALYARAGQWLAAAGEPFLLVLETVTTHQPYTDPETGERSLEGAMRYADRAFGYFLRDLDATGYFDRGILAVVSDHRSMTPVPARELEAWGPAALSRVPAFVIGPDFSPGLQDERVYSQSDLVPSFELWLGGSTRLDAHQDVMFGRPERDLQRAPDAVQRCAFHSRFDLRGRVDVHCERGWGQVRLDGDDSALLDHEDLDPSTRQDVLTTLAVLRLEGLQRHHLQELAATADLGD
jgi:phosphoglycerol transferase MdoB-like AlkP superfamily enzyme